MKHVFTFIVLLAVVSFFGACDGSNKDSSKLKSSEESYMERYNRVVGEQTIWGKYDGTDMRDGSACEMEIKKDGTGKVTYQDHKYVFEWKRHPGSDPNDQFDQRFIIYSNGRLVSNAQIQFIGLTIDSGPIKGPYIRQK